MAEQPQKSSVVPDAPAGVGGPLTAADGAPAAGTEARPVEPLLEDGAPSGAVEPQAAADRTGSAPLRDEQSTDESTSEGEPNQPYRRIEAAILTGVDRVLDAFERKLAYDAAKQLQVDRLHAELQEHRADLAARTARPLVYGMIRLHDDIGKLLSSLRGKPAGDLSPERFFTLLEGLQEDVEIVLGQNGVTAYREPVGVFDPRRQRALRKVVTNDQNLAGRVAETIRSGFEQGSDIIEKERVATYEFEPPRLSTPGAASSEADGSLILTETTGQEG